MYVDLSGLLEGKFDGALFYEKHRDYFRYLRMWLDYVDRYDKVLYGTDWPLINIRSYIDTMKLVVPAEHHQEFFYDNALRVYSKLQALLPQGGNQMITGNLAQLDRLLPQVAGNVKKALELLKEVDVISLPNGKTPLDGGCLRQREYHQTGPWRTGGRKSISGTSISRSWAPAGNPSGTRMWKTPAT